MAYASQMTYFCPELISREIQQNVEYTFVVSRDAHMSKPSKLPKEYVSFKTKFTYGKHAIYI